MIRKLVAGLAVGVAMAAMSQPASSQADDRAVLAGAKELKVAFDVLEGDAKALLNRLNVIDETRASLIKQGVTPHFVVAFRGPATKLVQTDASKIKPEDREDRRQARRHEQGTGSRLRRAMLGRDPPAGDQGRERAAFRQGRGQQLDLAHGLPVQRLRLHPAIGGAQGARGSLRAWRPSGGFPREFG